MPKINIGNRALVMNLKLLDLEPKVNDKTEFVFRTIVCLWAGSVSSTFWTRFMNKGVVIPK